MVVQVENADKYAVGDVWYGVSIHIYPTATLHKEVQVVENNTVVDAWKVIARDRKITI